LDLVQRSCGNISPEIFLSVFSPAALFSVYNATRCQKPQNYNPVLYRYLISHTTFMNSGNAKHRKSHGLHVAIKASRNLEIITPHSILVCNIVMLVTRIIIICRQISGYHKGQPLRHTYVTINNSFLPKATGSATPTAHTVSRYTSHCSFSDLKVLETNMKDGAAA